jgi:hypothetical protein
VDKIFSEHRNIRAIIHCAALTAVPDSALDPLRYYRENVAKSVSFIASVVRNGCDRPLSAPRRRSTSRPPTSSSTSARRSRRPARTSAARP